MTQRTVRVTESGVVAAQLDEALHAGGKLAALVVDAPAVIMPDDEGRIGFVIDHPTRLDARAVELLADVLAAERRLDDVVAARLMLPTTVAQHRAVQELAAQARGAHAPALHEVAAEWTQFLGWLYAEDGRHGEAVRVLTEAADQADAVGSGVLAAQAESAPAPSSAYWLTPTFGRMNIGLAHLALGGEVAAADHLRAGLDSLPEGQRDAEWTREYRQALTTAGG